MNRKPVAFVIALAAVLVFSGSVFAKGISDRGGAPEEPEFGLPLSDVVLFATGIGYFQRTGLVEGDATIDLFFRQKDVNDLLKSMVLQDYDGGSVTSVNYSSREPIAATLETLAVDLTQNPGLAALLAQIRGEAIIVESPASGISMLKGSIIGVEYKTDAAGRSEPFVNLLTTRGIRSIRLEEVKTIRFEDPVLEEEFRHALSLLASERRSNRKRVSVRFSGEGSRRVMAGYLLETPVWKTSYRLVLGDGEEHYLQGWALVENTTEEDWHDVGLTLVAGRPVSFIMDLYRPIFIPRPVIEPEVLVSAASRAYETESRTSLSAKTSPELSPPPMAAEMFGSGIFAEESLMDFEPELDLSMGVRSSARAEEAGEFFRYVIGDPVTLPRKESAMVPIVNTPVRGVRYGIYNAGSHPIHPYNGLKLENTMGIDLMAGPITVFEAGSYAGDARIGSLRDGEFRYLSYSLDLDTEVGTAERLSADRIVASRIVKGVLSYSTLSRVEIDYTVVTAGGRDRSVLIEHPVRSGWELIVPAEPYERTAGHYRFLVEVGTAAPEVLTVAEERTVERTTALKGAGDSSIQYFIDAEGISATVKAALNGIITRRTMISETLRLRQESETERISIQRDQARIRENLGKLEKESELYKRYVSMLGEQEDRLIVLEGRIRELTDSERQQRIELDRYIDSIQTE